MNEISDVANVWTNFSALINENIQNLIFQAEIDNGVNQMALIDILC